MSRRVSAKAENFLIFSAQAGLALVFDEQVDLDLRSVPDGRMMKLVPSASSK
jgi:hypothetical protein